MIYYDDFPHEHWHFGESPHSEANLKSFTAGALVCFWAPRWWKMTRSGAEHADVCR